MMKNEPTILVKNEMKKFNGEPLSAIVNLANVGIFELDYQGYDAPNINDKRKGWYVNYLCLCQYGFVAEHFDTKEEAENRLMEIQNIRNVYAIKK